MFRKGSAPPADRSIPDSLLSRISVVGLIVASVLK
jgi:hypothetical protein